MDRNWLVKTVEDYAQKIERCEHFAEASYRDGEWRCMLGHKGHNINGEVYTEEFGAALRKTLLEPVGQRCVYWPEKDVARDVRRAADNWIKKNNIKVEWIVDRALARANERGLLSPFFKAVRTRRVVIVGPHYISKLPEKVVGSFTHVEIPLHSAWKEREEICRRVYVELTHDALVLFCAGMATNLIVHTLWPEVQGRVTLLDIGSILDPYCGVFSRGYQNENWRKTIMERNLE